MISSTSSDQFPAEDFRATASAFSQLAGVLAGFCFTILVLLLSPDFLKSSSVKDWVLGLLLFAAFSYVLSSSFLANSMNSLLIKRVEIRSRVFHIGMLLCEAGHFLLATTLTILVYQLSSTVGMIAAVVIVLVLVVDVIVTLGRDFHILKTKQ